MSYDFYLTSHCEACDTDHHHFNKNYTSNVAPMFAHRFKDGIHVINNENANVGGRILFTLLEHFLDNKEELEKLYPKNGWLKSKFTLAVTMSLYTGSFIFIVWSFVL